MAQMTVTASGPRNAKIMIVGDAPTEQDLRRSEPFIGGGGFELTKMLTEAGIRRDDCYMTLVLKSRCYPNELNIIENLYDACMALREEVELVKPNVICTVGDLALFALTGVTSSFNYRSSIMDSVLTPGYKVIPTLRSDIIHTQYARRPWMVHDLKRVKKNSLTPGLFHRDYKLLIAVDNSEQSFECMANRLWDLHRDINQSETQFPLACDIETRGGHITCISFAWASTEGLCIQLSPLRNPEGFWETEQEAELVFWMQKILTHPNTLLVGQNFNYDLQYIFRHWGILPSNVADTMLMQHSAFSNLPKNLGFLSSMYCEDHLYWKDDRTDWKEGEDGEDEMKYWEYCATDSCRTLAVYHVLKSVLKGMGLEKVNEFQQRLRPKVLKSMIRGVRVDQKKRSELSMTLMEEAEKRKQWMREVLGYEINYRSPVQMQDFFYRQMGMKKIMSRTGGVTTNDAALQSLGAKEPILWPVIRKISELRSLGVFHSTFVLAPLDADRRMRCSFNIAGTETYRFSSSKNAFGTGMNLQNVPKGGDTSDLEGALELPNIRELFIPDEGQTFFDIDLDSADLRIVTWESNCQWMKDNFREGRKPYVEVMKEYYHDQSMSKNSHPREYAMFKSLCHGTNYLGTAEGIAPRIGLNVHETERIQKWYFGLCPEIAKWQSDVKKQVSGRRYVENAFGYRNYFFDKIEGTIFNQAIAWIPQSSVACLINRAYVAIDDAYGDWIQILLQVHDSLAGQFPTNRKDEALELIRNAASIAIPYEDPLYFPVGVISSEKSWGECG
jgi:uracil-DNA glycosylase family 4